jgi:hypothetical protein
MALFQKSSDPLKIAKRDHEKLSALMNEAEAATVAATAAANALALDGADHAALEAAESRVRISLDIVTRRKTALVQSDEKIARLETELATAQDAKLRRETAAAVEKMAADIQSFAAEFDLVVGKLVTITTASKEIVWEATGLHSFAITTQAQVPEATQLIASLLRSHATAVLNGSAPATLAEPPAPFIEPTPVIEPTVELFTLRSIKWRDHNAVQKVVHQYNDVQLPQRLAENALACRACVPITDSRRALRGSHGSHPNPAHAYDLDSDAEPSEPGVADSNKPEFQVVDRGPPFRLMINR